jgi:hypothetical protein
LFEENAKDITAVKVYCPGNFLIKLTALDGVYLVETEDSFSKDDFSAIDTSSEYDYYPDYSTTEPVTKPRFSRNFFVSSRPPIRLIVFGSPTFAIVKGIIPSSFLYRVINDMTVDNEFYHLRKLVYTNEH